MKESWYPLLMLLYCLYVFESARFKTFVTLMVMARFASQVIIVGIFCELKFTWVLLKAAQKNNSANFIICENCVISWELFLIECTALVNLANFFTLWNILNSYLLLSIKLMFCELYLNHYYNLILLCSWQG